MYDNFEPFQELEGFNFNFGPRYFEIYFNGKLIEKDSTEIIIGGKNNENNQYDSITIVIGDVLNALNNQIKTYSTFDKIVTSTDRIVLLKIPQISTNSQMNMLAKIFGPTRRSYNFDENEPYTCSVFAKNSEIVKLSFNLYNNKLIEFYL